MYNLGAYNTFAFNTTPEPVGAENIPDVSFCGYSLANDNILLSEIDIEAMPVRDLQSVRVPRGHGQIVVGDFWDKKMVRLRGMVIGDDSSDLERKLDDLKKNLAIADGELDIVRGGVVRRFIATLVNADSCINRAKHYMINRADIVLEFVCMSPDKPFGEDVFYSSYFVSSQTLLTLGYEVSHEGSAFTLPVFILTFSAVNNITSVEITNTTTNEAIKIDRTFAVTDRIKIDGEQVEVSNTGEEIGFAGTFPRLINGKNSLKIVLTGTSATYNLTTKWKNRYY